MYSTTAHLPKLRSVILVGFITFLCATQLPAQERPASEPQTDPTSKPQDRTGQTDGATRGARPNPRPNLGTPVEQVMRPVIPIYMKPGLKEGVRLNQVFLLYEVGTDGSRIVIGKAFVAILGPGYVAAGPGVSRADNQKTLLLVYEYTRRPTRGTMLEETGEFFDTRDLR